MSLRRFGITMALGLICSGPLLAEPAGNHPPLISVSGTSEMWLGPDQIQLSVHLASEDADAGQAMARNQILLDRLRGLLANYRLEPGSFQVTDVTLSRPYQNGVRKTTFEATRDCSFTLADVQQRDEILLTFARGDLGEIRNARASLKNPIPIREKARIEALKEAQRKAQAMAGSLQQTIGKAYWIEEVTPELWTQPTANMITRNPGDDAAAGLGMIRVQATVRASFLLQP